MVKVSIRIRIFTLILGTALAAPLAACLSDATGPESPSPSVEATAVPHRAPAAIEAVDIFQDDTFPVEVSVMARGHFPNECTAIDQISQERRGGTFYVAIDSVQYGGEICPENRVAFEELVELDLVGLPAGVYVVDVNGLQGTFKLQRDNVLDEGNAVVGGQVWDDRCQLVEPEEGGEFEPTVGCVDRGDGLYRGNGAREEDELGVAGVKVQLGAGPCPSTGLATTLTDEQGTFFFSGLTAGDYCLTATDVEDANDILSSAVEWTYPAGGAGEITVSLQPGDSRLTLEFGRSLVLQPKEPLFFATPAAECTNKALFIADLTIADDTSLMPGEVFTKTWQLQNLGSCTWDSSYSLVPTSSDGMGEPISVPLTIAVPPGEYGNLSVQLVAPTESGTYRGEWQLKSPEGLLFGIGPGSDRPFWVQIVVVEDQPAG